MIITRMSHVTFSVVILIWKATCDFATNDAWVRFHCKGAPAAARLPTPAGPLLPLLAPGLPLLLLLIRKGSTLAEVPPRSLYSAESFPNTEDVYKIGWGIIATRRGRVYTLTTQNSGETQDLFFVAAVWHSSARISTLLTWTLNGGAATQPGG